MFKGEPKDFSRVLLNQFRLCLGALKVLNIPLLSSAVLCSDVAKLCLGACLICSMLSISDELSWTF